ncbi:sigma-54-dependent Fis family transcriptional regulator [Niallia sp. Krafla_26]|uniref:sigma-54-dependent Fis family transcriptional regulator n=1 Tax=Niallia sp. Krafla_26 TaxID=3064703 RepID=UPI003D1631DA
MNNIEELSTLEKTLEVNWQRFLKTGVLPENQRSVIHASWDRCKQHFVNPLKMKANIIYYGNALEEKREQNQILLDNAKPIIDSLFQYYSQEMVTISLFDSNGIMIDHLAHQSIADKIEISGFIPGSDWSENVAGTNAIGTGLLERKPLQVFSREHFCQGWHPWVCTSAPIRDPFTNQVIGMLGLTSEKDFVIGHDIELVKNQSKKISHSLSLSMMKEHGFLFQSLYSSNQDPVIIFDLSGKMIWGNHASTYLLHVSEGISLSQFLGYPQDEILTGSPTLQINGNLIDGKTWDITIHPFRIGSQLLGGMAIFQKNSAQTDSESSRKQLTTKHVFDGMVANTNTMTNLIEKAKKAAFSDKNLFIHGETGTGKELLVQSIHAFGPRKSFPFVAVNCGAIPKELMATELFGYESGAFTGAKTKGKKGKFLLADKGTIFLDEIGDLPLDVQVYLLRVLEEREIVPVGGNESVPIDVRVVCATHKNLEEEVRKGNFREDLFYRLNVISLELPPLRERKEDIPLLIEKFLMTENKSLKVSEEAKKVLIDYHWPGNIRQLKNCIEQAVFHANSNVILPGDLPKEIRTGQKEEMPKKELLKTDKDTLLNTLHQCNGNVTKTAQLLNISRMTVYRKIKQYHLTNVIK